LFYFKLGSVPEVFNSEFISTGFILCGVYRTDLAFRDLLD
jgi:hypothetical protein